MRKTARILYLIIGVLITIPIGLLHTYAHFTDLMTPAVKEYLNGTLTVTGNEQSYFAVWGVVSFMMGAAFVVIGLLNLTIYSMMKKEDYPPIFALITMTIYLFCVIYVGYTFNATPQLYGGIFGLILTSITFYLTLRVKSE